jgi:hypothetical protein
MCVNRSFTERKCQHSLPDRNEVPVRILLQIKYAGTPLQKKGDSTSPLTEKMPVRIPLRKSASTHSFTKNMPVILYRRKVTVLALLQKKVPERIPLQKICRYASLYRKSAGTRSFITGAVENALVFVLNSKNRRFVDTVVAYFGSWNTTTN